MSVKEAEIKTDIYGVEEAIARSVIELTDVKDEKAKVLSELSLEEIPFVAMLFTVSNRYNLKNLEIFCKEFLKLRVSLDRKGRRELVRISTAEKEMEKQKVKGISSLFSGLKG